MPQRGCLQIKYGANVCAFAPLDFRADGGVGWFAGANGS